MHVYLTFTFTQPQMHRWCILSQDRLWPQRWTALAVLPKGYWYVEPREQVWWLQMSFFPRWGKLPVLTQIS